jgi:hypothetical protein
MACNLCRWLQAGRTKQLALTGSLDERVEVLADCWEVISELVWPIVKRYAALHTTSLPDAVDQLCRMEYGEARRAVGLTS